MRTEYDFSHARKNPYIDLIISDKGTEPEKDMAKTEAEESDT